MTATGPAEDVGWTVGDLARAAGVTVRTLHHYDEIGVLVPSGRTPAGYRSYSYADLLRLQRVLGYRALGLGLDEIAALLDDPNADPVEQLRAQHALLGSRVADLRRQIAAIEKTMEAYSMGIQLTPQEMFEVFGDDDPTMHAAEAQQRWGQTPAYRESHRRTSAYTKADWQRMKSETAEVEDRYLAAFRSGLAAGSDLAMDAAEAHRQSITAWFYDCSYDAHRGLAQMYVSDERFTAHYDDQAAGLARYVHDAVMANADRSQ
jgi:DNA-binding transcriptional MerR regulator